MDAKDLVDGFFLEWSRVAAGRMRDFKPQELSNSIYGMALLGLQQEDVVDAIIERVALLQGKFTIENLHQLVFGCAFYKRDVPDAIQDDLERAMPSLKSAPTTSKLQQRVFRIVKEMKPDAVEELWIEELCVHVDIALVDAGIIIQVDGPYHDTKQAKDRLSTTLLERLKWKVMRISNRDINPRNDADLKQYTEERLKQIE